MLKVPSWMFEGLWLHLWPHLTYAINYFFHNRGFHHIKASPNKPMDWFLHKRAPHIVTWTPGPRWRVPGGGSRVPGPTNGSQVPDPTFQVCHSKETLRSETLLKRDSDTGVFLWNYKIFENIFFTEHLQWLLLTMWM